MKYRFRSILKRCAMWLLGVMSVVPCTAGVAVIRSVEDLTDEAGMVIVGTVAEIQHEAEANRGQVLVVPQEILKGTPGAGPLWLNYSNVRSFSGVPFSGVDPRSGRSLFFIQTTGPQLELIPMVKGPMLTLDDYILTADLPISSRPLDGEELTTPLGKVVRELAVIAANSSVPDRAATYLLASAWNGPDSAVSRDAFLALSKNPTDSSSRIGSLGLLMHGTLEGVESLVEAERSGRSELLAEGAPLLERFYSSTALEGVRALARWIVPEGNDIMRASAAGALARIHTADAVAVLGPALNMNDFQVQWRAVGGLAMFANNVPVGGAGGPRPGEWRFRTDDTIRYSAFDEEYVAQHPEIIEFWREWWADNAPAVLKLTQGSGAGLKEGSGRSL